MKHHRTQKWFWSFHFHFLISCWHQVVLIICLQEILSCHHCQHGQKTSAFTQRCAADVMAWSFIFLQFNYCHCTYCQGKRTANEYETVPQPKWFWWNSCSNYLHTAIWSAFKILCLNHSPWHSCTALNWVWTCFLLLFFTTNGHGSFHLPCSQPAIHSSPDGVVSQV